MASTTKLEQVVAEMDEKLAATQPERNAGRDYVLKFACAAMASTSHDPCFCASQVWGINWAARQQCVLQG